MNRSHFCGTCQRRVASLPGVEPLNLQADRPCPRRNHSNALVNQRSKVTRVLEQLAPYRVIACAKFGCHNFSHGLPLFLESRNLLADLNQRGKRLWMKLSPVICLRTKFSGNDGLVTLGVYVVWEFKVAPRQTLPAQSAQDAESLDTRTEDAVGRDIQRQRTGRNRNRRQKSFCHWPAPVVGTRPGCQSRGLPDQQTRRTGGIAPFRSILKICCWHSP